MISTRQITGKDKKHTSIVQHVSDTQYESPETAYACTAHVHVIESRSCTHSIHGVTPAYALCGVKLDDSGV